MHLRWYIYMYVDVSDVPGGSIIIVVFLRVLCVLRVLRVLRVSAFELHTATTSISGSICRTRLSIPASVPEMELGQLPHAPW